jgi:hypothetical protein
MKRKVVFLLFSAFATLILAGSACRFNFDEREKMTLLMERYYAIDPSTLLDSLEGSSDPFIPVETEPDPLPPSEQVFVNWHQADYLRIVETLFKKVWGETTEGWSLNSLDFSTSCTQSVHGFQSGGFQYFKNEMKMDGSEIRIERRIAVVPFDKVIQILEFEYAPRLVDWGAIDLKAMRYSADDAIRIAEREGGREKRLAIQNDCNIVVLLIPDAPRYRGWDIRYAGYEGTLLRMWIDPVTGKIRR